MNVRFMRLMLISVLVGGTIGCQRRTAEPGTTSSQQPPKQGATSKANVSDNPEQLIPAIDSHNIVALRQLLDRGVRADDFLPLCEAAERNNTEALALLLERGAKVEAKDQIGMTALVCAARTFDDTTEAMKLLIAKGAAPEDKAQALFAVAEAVIAMEVEVLPEKQQALLLKRPQLQTAMDPWDVANVKKAELLLHSGVSVNVRDKVRDNVTPLIWAATFGNTAVVQFLLSKGAAVEARDRRGDTALVRAACSCAIIDMPYTLDSMRLLLKKGADVEAKDNDDTTALMAAAGWGRSELLTRLLENGARIDDRDQLGDTALIIAARGSGVPTAAAVQVLLEKGAAVNAQNNKGDTALALAASTGGFEDAQVVNLLLANGADPSIKNNRGETALSLAEKNRRTPTVQLLKKAMKNRIHEAG